MDKLLTKPIPLGEDSNLGDGVIALYSGGCINVFDPNPKDVDIRDIAHALSNQCRFTGHTSEFYSVAQHSVHVSEICPPEHAGWGLLHDASEAYLSDIARPIKKHPDFGPFYLKVEARLTEAIMLHFGLDPYVEPKEVYEADDILIRTEARDLMSTGITVPDGVMLQDPIVPWTPKKAYGEFMIRFMEVL